MARIVLSRELGLDEIAKIRQECPDIELEVFVHGALCTACSGHCLLSGYFNRRGSNQGACTNACHWNYATQEAATDPNTGEAMAQRMEDEHGTYIMNSKDVHAVEHVQHLVTIGVDSLKIEGRTKSAYYVSRTAQVYRRAVDDVVAGRPFNPPFITEPEGLSNRGYTAGFLERRPAHDYQNYETGSPMAQRSQFVAQVKSVGDDSWAEVETKNRFAVDDLLEVVHPSGNRRLRLTAMKSLEGDPVTEALGSALRVRILLDGPAQGALLARIFEFNKALALAA